MPGGMDTEIIDVEKYDENQEMMETNDLLQNDAT